MLNNKTSLYSAVIFIVVYSCMSMQSKCSADNMDDAAFNGWWIMQGDLYSYTGCAICINGTNYQYWSKTDVVAATDTNRGRTYLEGTLKIETNVITLFYKLKFKKQETWYLVKYKNEDCLIYDEDYKTYTNYVEDAMVMLHKVPDKIVKEFTSSNGTPPLNLPFFYKNKTIGTNSVISSSTNTPSQVQTNSPSPQSPSTNQLDKVGKP